MVKVIRKAVGDNMLLNKGDHINLTGQVIQTLRDFALIGVRTGQYYSTFIIKNDKDAQSLLIDADSNHSNSSKSANSFTLYDGRKVKQDGYLECPHTPGVDCSIYLKGNCKDCCMYREAN